MVQGKKIAVASLCAAVSITLHGAARAQFVETTDAGQTLITASSTATGLAGTALTTINGSFAGLNDADLFAITITTPSTFSAKTTNAVTDAGGQDTALFLFDASGHAIATNDDAAGGLTLDSTLPAGNSLFATLAAGTYFLGISESGNEAINSASQLLFAGYPGGDTTAVRGAASGLNPTTLATFNSNAFVGGGAGAYEIDLTSAATATNPNAVPEPSAWTALGLGSLAAGALILRPRTRRA